MSSYTVFRAAVERVYQARRYIYIVYGLTLAIALVLGVMLAGTLRDAIGPSLAGERLREGFDPLWYGSFKNQAEGLAATFDPSVTGIGAVFNGLDALLTGRLFQDAQPLLGLGIFYWALWIFLAAGFIGMFLNASADGVFGQHFLVEAGRFFFRFLLLGLLAGAIYYLILKFLLPWMDTLFQTLLRDTIDERVAFGYTVGKYGLVWGLLLSINLIFDYSKIVIIDKDIGKAELFRAPWEALRFMVRHPLKVGGVYLLTAASGVMLLLLYWLLAPGAWQASWFTIILTFLIGQLYIVGRIAVRCLFYAGETILYQTQVIALVRKEEPAVPEMSK